MNDLATRSSSTRALAARSNMIPVFITSLAVTTAITVLPQETIPWPRADDFEATVSGSLADVRGDTIVVEYAVENETSSEQSIETFVVRYEGTPLSVVVPAPGWIGSLGHVQDSVAAAWAALGSDPDIQPGTGTEGFRLEGLGTLELVSFYLQADYAIPLYNDSLPDRVEAAPAIWDNAVRGVTIGLGALPMDTSPSNLVARLVQLTDSSCGLGWISEPGICNSIEAKQRAAARAVERDHFETACNQLGALANELTALPDTKITTEGRALISLATELAMTSVCD